MTLSKDASFLEKAAVGDTVRFKDMRGKKRSKSNKFKEASNLIFIVAFTSIVHSSGVIIEASKTTVTCAFHDTCYVNSGIKLRLKARRRKVNQYTSQKAWCNF